ncbi:MAG: hypothetical protein FE78DRAFT_148470 [Acidomyces sp. 'richmondensis']|nr:MAG: hypothetical protein FE78DRAFT_148470 [Acidomyces sp. 'richmondensis']
MTTGTVKDEPLLWLARPQAKACEVPYSPPPTPKNPVIRGQALYWLAKLVAASGFVQSAVWANAGFGRLRDRDELENIEPRYEPTVVNYRATGGYFSVLDYHEAYKAGKLTPIAVVEALLPLIRRDVKEPTKHSVAFLDSKVDQIRQAAEESTQRYQHGRFLSVLDGVPVAVKDELDVAGYQKCLGSKLNYTSKSEITSYCVQQWLDAGAVLMGKTNMHELGMDTTNNNPNFGTPLNPHNERYYCGGSSGGSAYAVAAGLLPIAQGNDGGGSIRIPSAYCGLYGLKPSHARVSMRPSCNLAKTTDVAGPFAANMVDLEIAYRVMAKPDALDPDSMRFIAPQNAKCLSPRRKVLGIFRAWFNRADAPVRDACEKALEYLTSELGYETVDITIPLLHDAQIAHAMTILCEVASGVPSVANLTPANQILISCGSKTPGIDILQAQKLRNLLMQHMAHLYEKHPGMIVITGTTPNAGWSYHPSDLRHGCSDGNMQIRNMEYVYLANFVGCPAISVPVAYVDPVVGSGRVPVGMMGMGEWCSEDELIAFGYDCEKYLADAYVGGRAIPMNFVNVMELAEASAEP